ncbi:hypothetical protein BgAZ_108680 [Babesia gibsoni]|uniref:Transmembrane protein n=1 Tax=Babesia gibsoni TaxID=33632 RepID=A0AAD8PGQ3_BABGI|nr:hypothetical protein BgAZ_108680 [Babesia gibsoni]
MWETSLEGSLKAFCKVFRRDIPLSGDVLLKEFRKVEQVDRHWEIPFRRRYLAYKEEECRDISKSLFIYGFTQWDFNTLICGAFLAQGMLGGVTLSPISVIICFFAFACMMQLRIQRDKLTLNYNILCFSSYIILMINLMIVQPDNLFTHAGVAVLLALSVVHFVVLMLLGMFTSGKKFERFADTCLQFMVPTVTECNALLMGIIACLGIAFAVVRLYCMANNCLIVFIVTSIARFGIVESKRKTQAQDEQRENEQGQVTTFTDVCMSLARALIGVIFTIGGFAVAVFTLIDGNLVTLGAQDAFRAWESEHNALGEYVFSFKAMTGFTCTAIGSIAVIQVLFLLKFLLRSPSLRNALQRQTIFMAKSCVDRKGGLVYSYNTYTVDRRGYVVDVDTLASYPLEGFNRSSLTCYDIYLAMQKRALHAVSKRSLYCHVPILHLYSCDKDSNILVRSRVRLERMANELDDLIADERERRHEMKLERERLRRIQLAIKNRPQFISTSIPSGIGIPLPEPERDDPFCEVKANVSTFKRTMSIPVDLSLKGVEELASVTKKKENIYQRRCVTTSVEDDFHWRKPGIIDRVRCSWLDDSHGYQIPSARLPIPGTARVHRDPTKGEFNFNKIDTALSNIFMGLQIMNNDRECARQATDRTASGRIQRKIGSSIDIGDTPFSKSASSMERGILAGLQSGRSTPLGIIDTSKDVDAAYIDIPEHASQMSLAGGTKATHGARLVANDAKSAHYIDIDTTKSALPEAQIHNVYSKDMDKQPTNWGWLDNTVNAVLGCATDASWIKGDIGDDIVYDRIRPIEEALEAPMFPHVSPFPTKYIVLTDSPQNISSLYPMDFNRRFDNENAFSQRSDCESTRSNFILTREYETHQSFALESVNAPSRTVTKSRTESDVFITIHTENNRNVEDLGQSAEFNEKKESDSTGLSAKASTVDDVRRGSSIETCVEASPNSKRRFAASQHLPLALDSRHERVYQVLPATRYNGFVENGRTVGSCAGGAVCIGSTSPLSRQQMLLNAGSGCDFSDDVKGEDEGTETETVTSAASSVASAPSPMSTPVQPVVPKRQWRNEFDFSPVALQSAEDVMMELMQDVNLTESGPDDHVSDVSYDFIFGR